MELMELSGRGKEEVIVIEVVQIMKAGIICVEMCFIVFINYVGYHRRTDTDDAAGSPERLLGS